jgi:regulator-associated protein of mTOR
LASWMDSPSIYVFDCSSAGTVLETFVQVFNQKEKESRSFKAKDNIVLAACRPNSNLPMNPNFPADLFTSCLTTPIKIALRWFCENNRLLNNITLDMVEQMPGRINDRRTPLGELNWIFTAVTDAIAWSVLPRDLFHKLFRQDLLVASLFRNFLLADRIMRTANCIPMSYPKLPPTHNHELWASWDLALDMCVSQLPKLLENPMAEYEYSSFFSSQLTDFQVWLDFGQRKKEAPKQLPILLQVLLSQTHRLRALTLLGRFLDMGSWAVNLALSVGIFPYVLKLLQSNSPELRQILVFIWAKILVLDPSCQVDLVKDNGHLYFINTIANKNYDTKLRAIACFVLTVICNKFPAGQAACFQYHNLLNVCASQLSEKSSHLRQWLCLLIGKLIENYPEAQVQALDQNIHEKIAKLLSDKIPEVRAAAVYALQCFVKSNDTAQRESLPDGNDRLKETMDKEMQVGASLYQVILDGSPLVRRELILALSTFLDRFAEHISPDLLRTILEEYTLASLSPSSPSSQDHSAFSFLTSGIKSKKKKHKKMLSSVNAMESSNRNSVQIAAHVDVNVPRDMKDRDLSKKSYFALDICRVILMMCSDPLPLVSSLANQVLKYIKKNFLKPRGTEADRIRDRSTINLATSPLTNSDKPPAKSSLLSPKTSRLSSRLFIRKSVSETDIASKQKREVEEEITLPVSIYYEWCCEYFASPLLPENQVDQDSVKELSSLSNLKLTDEESEEDMPSSSVGSYTTLTKKALSRKKRLEQLIQERQILIKTATHPSTGKRKLEDHGFFGNETDIISHMKFHSIEPWLIVSDERDNVTIWNWVRGHKVSSWSVSTTFKAPTIHPKQSTYVGNIGANNPSVIGGADEIYESTADCIPAIQLNTSEAINNSAGDMRITDFQLVNEHCPDERSLLLVATSNGNVCLYANYHHSNRLPRMITAIKAAPEVISRSQGPGVITCWQQRHGTLIVGGDLEHVKIWDMKREWCVQSLPIQAAMNEPETPPTQGTACVTSLAADQSFSDGHVFVAGLSDGNLLLYDRRIGSKYSVVSRLKEKGDDNWIVNVHIQKVNSTQIISGNSAGVIRFWDTRVESSVKTFDINDSSGMSSAAEALFNIDESLLSGGIGSSKKYTTQRPYMTTLAVHDYAPVLACGSNNQFVKVFNTSGESLSTFYYHDGFLGQRIGPISSLEFHPYRMCLAAGSTDSIISIYGYLQNH